MEPSFWSWEKRRFDPWLISKICAAMEPSFWSWEKPEDDPWSEETWAAAMEPSFWSWEKHVNRLHGNKTGVGRNGAQLLELGKGVLSRPLWPELAAAMEPSFWSWEKCLRRGWTPVKQSCRNGAQLLELGKELAIFSPTDYQCCTSLRAAEVLGQTSRVVAP